MRGADIIIPARFLSLVGHLCVVITLLWESRQITNYCLPAEHHGNLYQIYHSRLVAGNATSVALIIIELITFMSGLTMFSPSVSFTSVAAHCTAPIILTYLVLGGWFCDWFWPSFTIFTVVPSCVDFTVALLTLWTNKWRL